MAGKDTIAISFVLKDGENGLKQLIFDADGLRKIMAENVKVAEGFQKKVFNIAATASSIQSVSSAVQQLNGFMQHLTAESLDFGKAMKAANTMAGKDAAGFKQLKGEVAELAKTIPIARDQLANGLYQVVSNGVPEDNWISFLETSARSAVGGIADINKVVGVTSTLIKNYGLEWSAAANIQDKIQLTAKNGVTSFEQLAQALPRVTGNAATLGVSIDELMGTFATLTGVSGNTAEVSTQLAAIFTALVKPGSEAADMAARMGIQFDAAAIKAAGGFQNFLQQLDSSVKSYAQASGVLEQEVYGRLFGSAEAIRALIPLQGELADKFTANVANMVNSAGTVDAAFAEMSDNGDATARMLKNQLATFSDWIASVTAGIQPYLDLGAASLGTAANIGILVSTYKQLNLATKSATAIKKLAAIFTNVGSAGRRGALGLEMLALSGGKASKAAVALKISLRGLLAASGIGLAFVAVTSVLEYFCNTTDKATDSTNHFLNAQERAKRDAETLEQLRQRENSTMESTLATLTTNIGRLKEFNGTKEQEAKLVAEMNNTYGETMGYFSSVADWYKALIANSKDYCRQMVAEARTRILADTIAKKERENHDIIYNDDGTKRTYSTKRERETINHSGTDIHGNYYTYTTEGDEIVGTSDLDKATENYKSNLAAIEHLTQQLEDAFKEKASIEFKVKGSSVRPKASDGGSDSPNTHRPLSELEKRAAERPESLDTLSDYDAELSYQAELRLHVSEEDLADVDATMERLRQARDVLERKGHTPVPTDQITTYRQLNAELAYYNSLLDDGTEAERVAAQERINELAKIKEKWDESLADLNKPADISALDSIGELEAAISFYRQKQKKASGDEIQDIQKTIEALERKHAALQRGIEIPSLQKEVSEVNALTGRDYTVKIKGMGFDALTEKIRALQKMLDDTENPVTDQQRSDIESLIATYEQWRKEGIDAFGTFRQGWDSIKGIGSGIEGLTETLKGNGNAWQTVTGIVDGFLQIYDGVKTVVGIVNMLSEASALFTTTKTAEAVAVGASTGAQVAEAAVAETTAVAQIPVIAANKAAAASYMELAAAAYFAAHAYIPFAGFGIASSFVAASAAIVEGIGLMPFANGGIISGPTIGLMGEYAGASNNPEVVAPLDKLRTMLKPSDAGLVGSVVFRIEGRTLVGVIEKETKIKKRS